MKIKYLVLVLLIICSVGNANGSHYNLSTISNSVMAAYDVAVLNDTHFVSVHRGTATHSIYITKGEMINNEIVWNVPELIGYDAEWHCKIARCDNNSFTIIYSEEFYGVFIRRGEFINNVLIMGNKVFIPGTNYIDSYSLTHLDPTTLIVARNGAVSHDPVRQLTLFVYELNAGIFTLTNQYDIHNSIHLSYDIVTIDDNRVMVHYRGRNPSCMNVTICEFLPTFRFKTSTIDTASFADGRLRIINDTMFTLISDHRLYLGTYNNINILSSNYSDFYHTSVNHCTIDFFNYTHCRLLYAIYDTPHYFINGTYNGLSMSYDTPVTRSSYFYHPECDVLSNRNSVIINWGDVNLESMIWKNIINYPDPIPDPTPTPHSNSTATNHTQTFDDLFDDLSVWSFLTVIFATFELQCGGDLFWLIIIMVPFTMIWIKQRSVIIPSILALVCGSVLFTMVPESAIAPIKILLTIGIAGIFYHIIKSR